jgi:hypothetical protein
MSPGAKIGSVVPNDVVRRVRRHYLVLLASALVLGFVTFLLAGNGLVPPFATMLLLVASIGLLVFAVLVLRSGICPRCKTSLMWQESRGLTASRISLFTKKSCPSCGLDLDQPFAIMEDGKS